ncbi:MAG: hypothetical protein IJS40_07070 [Synergistaceae bacterium]|nr:hypothetical protein [Synergistaceae bacterium]
MKKLLFSLLLLLSVTLGGLPASATYREGHLTYSGMDNEEYVKFMYEAADNGS